MTERALERQVGGGHYVKLRIQPVEFALINGLDAAAFSILKYLTRHRDKAGVQDVDKAIHFFHLRCEIGGKLPPPPKIGFDTYAYGNGLPNPDAEVIVLLGDWVRGFMADRDMRDALQRLRDHYYPEEALA